jgi:hypothetical protein
VLKINGIAIGNIIVVECENILVGQVIKFQYINEKNQTSKRYSWEVVFFDLNKNIEMCLSPIYEFDNGKFVRKPSMMFLPCTSYICHINTKQVNPEQEIISPEVLESINFFKDQKDHE